MKTIYTSVLFIISLFPAVLQAKQVSQETAQQVAESQVRSHSRLRSGEPIVLNLVHTETTGNRVTNSTLRAGGISSTNVVYYVFNVDSNGFVIVSGDDIAVPVLGYSNSGTYDPDNLSPNFVYYLNSLSLEIKEAMANDLPQSEETKEQWDAYSTGNTSSLRAAAANTPLLDIEGIKWSQDVPYNGMCPLVKDSLSLTGCVATAMAQIMRYYKYPSQGNGTTASYFSYSTDSLTVITIPKKDLSQSIYDWNNMLPTYYRVDYNTVQQNAVALLMYDCGISTYMQYDTPNYGSGAMDWDAGNALINNFSYSKRLTYKIRDYYSDTEWETVLKAEIDAGRPIFYAGQDISVGHAFVCDGYDGNYFHFNWGWNGQANGFFLTTALNPNVNPPYHFNQDQEILAGISPTGVADYEIILYGNTSIPLKFSSSKDQVINNSLDRFNVSTQYYSNIGFAAFSGYLGLALYDQNNQFVKVLVIDNSGVANLQSICAPNGANVYSEQWSNLSIPSSVLPGNYFIKPIVISTTNDTVPVHVPSGTYLPLTVVSNKSGLEEINSAQKANVYEANGLIQVMSDTSNPIKEIAVYNLQGKMIYKAASINAISYTVNQKLPVGVYIVTVISEKNTNNVQLILH